VIVLEHGAWADGSSWDRVIRRLQNAGFTVYAPPNPLREARRWSDRVHLGQDDGTRRVRTRSDRARAWGTFWLVP